MLSSAIKSDVFTPQKKSCFYKMKSLERRQILYFCENIFVTKTCFTKFSLKISQQPLRTRLNFIVNVFHFEFYCKNQVHGSHHGPSNIFHKSVIILTFHICIQNLSLVSFLRIYLVQQISIHQPNLYSHSSFCILNFQQKEFQKSNTLIIL